MHRLKVFFVLFLLGYVIESNAQAQITKLDSVYINYVYQKDTFENLESKKKFKIVYEAFSSKEIRDGIWKEYEKKRAPAGELKLSVQHLPNFYFYLYYGSKENEVNNIDYIDLKELSYLYENIRKIGHRTKVFFVERLGCEKYIIYEARLEFEE